MLVTQNANLVFRGRIRTPPLADVLHVSQAEDALSSVPRGRTAADGPFRRPPALSQTMVECWHCYGSAMRSRKEARAAMPPRGYDELRNSIVLLEGKGDS